ncbi:hypothetical protein SAMN06265348_101241 [Pedobacter westerhofensis]|uniref:Uncharacterized protein n=1 Tax=Pedobacter westerhofensis TaxID=425512 RepID=A0A521AIP9_9SPHI|nr:hypothetical protein SAMN06265348_101241 [Pedobacter westerhofensis]
MKNQILNKFLNNWLLIQYNVILNAYVYESVN